VAGDLYFEIKNLKQGTCYYVVVTAVNEHGEGYKAKATMIRTLSENVVKDPCTLYVWGNNANSELGLDDGQVLKNIAFYKKCALYKVIRQSLFENNSIL